MSGRARRGTRGSRAATRAVGRRIRTLRSDRVSMVIAGGGAVRARAHQREPEPGGGGRPTRAALVRIVGRLEPAALALRRPVHIIHSPERSDTARIGLYRAIGRLVESRHAADGQHRHRSRLRRSARSRSSPTRSRRASKHSRRGARVHPGPTAAGRWRRASPRRGAGWIRARASSRWRVCACPPSGTRSCTCCAGGRASRPLRARTATRSWPPTAPGTWGEAPGALC
jgi:hypothetical protein